MSASRPRSSRSRRIQPSQSLSDESLSQSQSQSESQYLSQSQSQSISDSQNYNEAPPRLVNRCVRHLISSCSTRIPVKKQELIDLIRQLDATFDVKRYHKSVIKAAADVIRDVYGYDVRAVGSKANIQYIVVLSEPLHPAFVEYFPLEEGNILLNGILSHIFMSGGSVTEVDLQEFVYKADLLSNSDSLNIKHSFQILIKQSYLKSYKINVHDIETTHYKWGQRAQLEVSKMDLLKNIAQALNRPINFWFEPHKIAVEEENATQQIV